MKFQWELHLEKWFLKLAVEFQREENSSPFSWGDHQAVVYLKLFLKFQLIMTP